MRQQTLELTPPEVKPPRVHVREVSIAQYVEGRPHMHEREKTVLRWLAWHFNRFLIWPTADELAQAITERDGRPARFEGFKDFTLHIRRGVNDLQRIGIVRAKPSRRSRVTGKRVTPWRVIPVGRLRKVTYPVYCK